MKKTGLPKLWLTIIMLFFSSFALAGCFHDKHHRGGDMMFEYLSWKLDLNEQQQTMLDDIKSEMRKIHEQTKTEKQQDKASAVALIEAETLDTNAVMTLINKKQNTINTHAPGIVEKLAALHATLTPEQKAIIVDKINNMGPHHRKHEKTER